MVTECKPTSKLIKQSGGGIGRRTIRDFSAYRRGIQNEKYTGSNPVLTTRSD